MQLEFNNLHLVTPTDAGLEVQQCHVRIVDGVVEVWDAYGFDPNLPNSCDGAIATPGLVNAHTHIYSALAAGLDPGRELKRFTDILEGLWWRLDKVHDEESLCLSAAVAAADCFRYGVTGVFDHHAPAPDARDTLSTLHESLMQHGLLHSLCLENSKRHGETMFDRLLRETQAARDYAMLGLHASFTLGAAHLELAAALDPALPVHIHVAEAEYDELDCQRRFGESIVERLDRFGLLRPGSIIAHGCWLSDRELELLAAHDVTLAIAPLSNLNNGQPPLDITRAWEIGVKLALATDGLGADVLGSWRQAFLQQRAAHPGRGFEAARSMLLNMCELKSRLRKGCGGEDDKEADLVIWDYQPAGPVTSDNIMGHLLYGVAGRQARQVVRGTEHIVKDCTYMPDYPDIEQRQKITRALWKRFKRQE